MKESWSWRGDACGLELTRGMSPSFPGTSTRVPAPVGQAGTRPVEGSPRRLHPVALWTVQTCFNDGERRTRPTPPTRSGVPLPTVALVLGPGEQGGGAQTKSRFRESPLRSRSLCFLACKGVMRPEGWCAEPGQRSARRTRGLTTGTRGSGAGGATRSVQFEETEFGAATFEPRSRLRVPCWWPPSAVLSLAVSPCPRSQGPSTQGPALLFPHGTLELGRFWWQRLAACSPDHSLASRAHSQSAVPTVLRREHGTESQPVDSSGENDTSQSWPPHTSLLQSPICLLTELKELRRVRGEPRDKGSSGTGRAPG